MVDLPTDARRAYNDLAADPRYQHFVRIPDRIIQCIDYFEIACNQASARTRLHAYYLFIGVVDDAIDSGRLETGKLVLEYLATPTSLLNEVASFSSLKLITEILKCRVDNKTHHPMMDKLRELYRAVVGERGATSIDFYIEHRKSVGSLTAELSYVLIQPDLSGEHETLLRFMKQVGAIGCLIDSLIDLNKDRRLGLLAFQPGLMGYAKLMVAVLRDGLRISLRHPRLYGLFFQAIVDNMRDPFRAEPTLSQHALVADRKDEAASVA